MQTTEKKRFPTLIDAIIAPVPNRWNSVLEVRARLTFDMDIDGGIVAAERGALGYCHHRIADLLDLLPAGKWTCPTAEVIGKVGEAVVAEIYYELVNGTEEEAEQIVALFHDAIPAPGSDDDGEPVDEGGTNATEESL